MIEQMVDGFSAKCWNVPVEESETVVFIGSPVRFSSRISRRLLIQKSHCVSERRSWSNMSITIISGKCRIEMEEKSYVVSAREHFSVPANVDHRIVAITDVRAIVSFDAVM